MKIKVSVECDECKGTGEVTMTCGVCGGSDDCDYCDGGFVTFVCQECKGTGVMIE